MTGGDIKRIAWVIFWKVRNHFIYVPDMEQFKQPEHWKSHADEVESGQVFKDDCDGFALTAAELLIRNGVGIDKIRISACKTETGEGHLVCIADGWLIDNRQRDIWPWNSVPYKWVSCMRLDEPGTWRTMNG